MFARWRRARDFDRRAAYDPSSVEEHPRGWRYVRVHSYGQASCDAWWRIDGDAYFLQVWGSAASSSGRPPGLYYRYESGWPSWYYLVAVLAEPTVTRAALEGAMSRFAECMPLEGKPKALEQIAATAA